MTMLLSGALTLLPIMLFGALAVAHMIHRARTAPARQMAQVAMRADQVAQRLDLALVEGAPDFVFMQMTAMAPTSRRVTMRGDVAGTPLELVYRYDRAHESSFGQVTVKTRFECRLTAQAKVAFPEFEVYSRNLGAIPEQKALLPPMQSGNAAVDAAFVIRTREPALAALLGAHLEATPTLRTMGLHLVGDGHAVSFLMHEKALPQAPTILYAPQPARRLVLNITRAVGGA